MSRAFPEDLLSKRWVHKFGGEKETNGRVCVKCWKWWTAEISLHSSHSYLKWKKEKGWSENILFATFHKNPIGTFLVKGFTVWVRQRCWTIIMAGQVRAQQDAWWRTVYISRVHQIYYVEGEKAKNFKSCIFQQPNKYYVLFTIYEMYFFISRCNDKPTRNQMYM